MVFIPRRSFEPTPYSRDEIHGAAPLVLAIVAIIGWALVAYLASQVMHMQSGRYDALGQQQEAIDRCGPPP